MAKPLRVLIVEDSEDDALLVIRELERGDYDTTFERVETAEAMAAALEKQAWDIILADHRLPHFSAPEALELFHQSGLDLPFIVISGAIGEETAVATMKAGAHDYIMKNNLARLLPAIERELREAEVREQRKQVQEELQIAEQNFRNSLDSSPLGIHIVTAEGELLYANQAMLDIYGYSSVNELKAIPAKQRYTPKSYAEHQERIQRRKLGKPVPSGYEVSIVRKDGETRHLLVSRKAVIWNGEVQFQTIYHDITARRQAEHDLNERMKELRCLYNISEIAERPDISPDVLYQETANQVPSGWQYPEITCCRITINEKEYRIDNYKETGWKQSADIKILNEAIGKIEVNYLEERPEIDEGPFLKEERHLINGLAERLGLITERIQAKEALRESEGKLRTIIDNTYDVIFQLSPLGIIQYVSPKVKEMYGFEPEGLIGKHLKKTTPVSELPKALKALKSVLSGKVINNLEINQLDTNGKIIPVEINATPVRKDGKIVAAQGVMRDVTERKKMEEQLLTNDRLASIGELVSGVAHELNNPLTGVIGFSDLLVGRKDLPDDVHEDLEVINREAKRTANIVRNLLTFARKHETEKEPTNINSIIEKVLELRAYEQKVSNIEINTRFAFDLPEITADGFRLQQVFINIIINAEHFMTEAHGRGTLTITTERAGDIIRASFTDDGPGIAKENLEHLFDPFFTTKEVGKGTGLGLSICYGIINEHGGRIYAESELGKGATFIVELPISK